MPPPNQTATASLAVSVGVAAAAALLAFLLWRDRSRRGKDLDDADVAHFAQQDLRRAAGVIVMLLLSAGIYFGSRIPPQLAPGRANPWFVQLWLAVFLLIFFLLGLGILDWMATHLYARRHRQAILRERMELLRDELQQRAYPTNGQQTPRNPSDATPT
jgi:hypothetical protein